jgi:ubiquinone/menaquinone biosynthesis C-methylase UbiE
MEKENLNKQVQDYWEGGNGYGPCGTDAEIVGNNEQFSKDWFEAVENYRYDVEPFIHSIAQFTRYRGKRVLEIGVGAGTDHLQWARAGADLYGVDLTDAGILTTRKGLEIYGLSSNLQRIDAEILPFDDDYFDVVYSWGVIHHSEHPEKIICEIKRVLRPSGKFIGMLYQRPSLTTLRVWFKHGLLKGRPFRSFRDVIYNHVESIGTKAYTKSEIRALFAGFSHINIIPLLTLGDTRRLPKWLVGILPNSLGWFLGIRATR